MIAEHFGECADCTRPIRPGERIVSSTLGWVHASCPTPPPVCPECWLEQPCGCDS